MLGFGFGLEEIWISFNGSAVYLAERDRRCAIGRAARARARSEGGPRNREKVSNGARAVLLIPR